MKGERARIWGRLEVLQRTAAELEISSVAGQNNGAWVEALTLGYTHAIDQWDQVECLPKATHSVRE